MYSSVTNVSPSEVRVKVGGLTPVSCESVFRTAMTKAFSPKQDVFAEGDAKRSVYRIESGAACLFKTMADGRRQVFDFAFPGEIIGLSASESYSCSAQAIGQLIVKILPISRLYQLASRDAELALGLYRSVSSELEATRDLLLTLGQQTALERVAIFLLTLSERYLRTGRNPRLLNIPMTRSDIGDLLGLTIETVSRSLTKLREQKVIEVIRGSLIQIIDLDGLKVLAGHVSYH